MSSAVLVFCLLGVAPVFGQTMLDQRLGFEENRGQYRPDIRFASRPFLYFTANTAVLAPDQIPLQFEGANLAAEFRPSELLPGALNLYRGNDPSRWMTGIPRYGALELSGIYDGVDAAFRAVGGPVCWLTLAPGTGIATIRMRAPGIQRLAVFEYLELFVSRYRTLVLGAPRAYQVAGGRKVAVAMRWTVLDTDRFGFTAAPYDASQPLTIEFGLSGSSPLGDSPRAGAVAPSGAIYAAGSLARVLTELPSADACGTDPLGTVNPCSDAVVAKYAPDGQLAFITLVGGEHNQIVDKAAVLAADSTAGESVVIAGSTDSTTFPTTPNAVQRQFAGAVRAGRYGTSDLGDLFVARFDGGQGTLIYSTLLGGPQIDGLVDLHAGTTGDRSVYLTGTGAGLPVTPGAYASGVDAFAARIDAQGSKLLYLTYLPDLPQAVDIGPDGGYYFAGGRFQPDGSSAGGFLSKLNAAGTALVYSTVLTDQNAFTVNGVAVDSRGSAWLQVDSVTGGAVRCCFLAKMDASGARVYVGPFTDQGQYPISIWMFHDQLIAQSVTAPVAPPPTPVPDARGGYVTRLDDTGKPVFVKAIPWSGIPIGIDAVGQLTLLARAPNGGDLEADRIDITPTLAAGVMAVVNAASLRRPRGVAPGEIVTLFGSGLGPSTGTVFQLDASGRVPAMVAGTRVWFNGLPAPVLYAQDTQVNAIVPYGIQPGTAVTVAVESQGRMLPGLSTVATETQPDIFTADASGSGQVLAFNQDGTLNSDSQPAARGSIMTIFLTGTGLTSPASDEFALASGILAQPVSAVPLTWGGNLEVLYAGPSPGSSTAITQVNFRVPDFMPSPGTTGVAHIALSVGTDEWVLRDRPVISVK